MLTKLDNLLRNRGLWCGLLLAAYLLPGLLAEIPAALAMPWVLIPNVHQGLYEFLRQFGVPSFYDGRMLLFAVTVHIAFWSLSLLLLIWGKRLSPPVLRASAALLLVLLVITIQGCTIAIDAVRH